MLKSRSGLVLVLLCILPIPNLPKPLASNIANYYHLEHYEFTFFTYRSLPLLTLLTITQTTISLDFSCATFNAGGASSCTSSPALIATELLTQIVTRNIFRISFVTVTAQLYTPLSGTSLPVTLFFYRNEPV